MKLIIIVLLLGLPLLSNKLEDMYLKKACNKNIALGCYNLAKMYLKKNYLRQGNLKALTIYDKSCKLNYSKACLELGEIYERGRISRRNHRKALYYYRKACSLNNYLSCNKYNTLKNKK